METKHREFCAKSTIHHTRFRTPGWASFDRKHREKQESGVEGAANPYPTISNEPYSGLMECSNNAHFGESSTLIQPSPTRSFTSVVRASTPVEFPPLKAHTKLGTSNIDIDGLITLKDNENPAGLLKDVHSWADQHLVEDILAAVNNDVGRASILLKEMVLSETETKNKQSGPFEARSSVNSNLREDADIHLEKSNAFVEKKMSHKELIVKQFQVPAEPDWEEDDVYLRHRKEALKMMRAVSQHSRGASNAFSRGDHSTARQLSSRAREERITAERLNGRAAEEILRIRNDNNGLWKLDLHGLHAAEAVHALRQRLERIEWKMMMNHSASPDELETIQPSFSLEVSSNAKGMIILPQQRQTLLQVITGAGNHSKGHASLPAAIKSFLTDGGYRFDDARPGVISVRPMFRHK